MATIDETMMNENIHYLTKEQGDKQYGSKGVAGTGLGLGIAGTALGILNSGGLLNNLFNGGTGTSSSTNTAVAAVAAKEEANAEKSTNRYIEITKEYYQNKIDSLRELTNSFYTLDQKIQATKDVTTAQSREQFDALNKRLIELEKSDAVQKATQPLYQAINDLKINNVNVAAQHGIFDANVHSKNMVDGLAMQTKSWIDFEAERRRCGDNTIVNYVNSTFYPRLTADISTASTTTQQPIYNPLMPPIPQV